MQAVSNAASCGFCSGKDLRGSCCKCRGRAALVAINGRQVGVGSAQAPGIILVYDEGNDNVADDRKAVRDVLTVGSASA